MAREDVIKSVEKAIKLLECFSYQDEELSFNDICKEVDLPKSTVSRLIQTLAVQNYLSKNHITNKYRLGVKLFYLGSIVQNSFNVRREALPIMLDLNARTRETVDLNVMINDERVCIEKVESNHTLRNFVKVGERHSLFFGASSKLLLSSLGNERIISLFHERKPDLELVKLLADVEQIRKQGYACTENERVLGGMAISAPIFDYTFEMKGCLTISGPSIRLTEQKQQLTEAVLKAANQLSYKLGFSLEDARQNAKHAVWF